jgi:predicted MFS family arabinose efflux permease
MRVGKAIAMTDADTGGGRGIPLYFLVPMLNFVGCAALFVAPVQIVGVAKAFGLGPSFAGGLLTGEILCSALAAFLLSSTTRRFDVRKAALAAVAVLIAGQCLSAMDIPLGIFAIARLAVGLAAGALYAFAILLASADPRGIRMLSVGTFVSNAVYGICLLYWPQTIDHLGLPPLFLGLAALALPLALGLLLGNSIAPGHAHPHGHHRHATALPLAPVILLAAVCTLGNGGFAMLWSFAQMSGELRGFGLGAIGIALGLSTVTGIIGSIVAGYLGWSKGLVRPLVVGASIGIFSSAMVALSAHIWLFTGGILLYGFATFLAVPYMLGIGGFIEPSGRAAMIAGSAIYLSGGLAPIVGGVIVDTTSVHAAEWTSSGLLFAAAICAALLGRYVRRPG